MTIHPSSGTTPETEMVRMVREVYAGINRDDPAAVLRLCHPRIERVEPEGFPSAGTYRGHEEMKAHLAQGRSTWAEGSCEPERFRVAGDKVIAFCRVRVRLKGRQEWIDGPVTDVFTFRDGKIIEMRTFAESREALDWVGVEG